MTNSAATRTIGIVGGTSPQSTISYYRYIVGRRIVEHGDHRYPRIVIASVSFQQYMDWQHAGEWDRIAEGLSGELRAVAAAGADFGLLAANTMHKVLPQIESPIPVLSILDAVAAEAKRLGIRTLGLTGTRFTMQDGFYQSDLEANGLHVLLPGSDDQATLHRIIFDELVDGAITPQSIAVFDRMAEDLQSRGAEAVLLACTELALLTGDRTLPYRTLDTTRIHAYAAYDAANPAP